MATAKTRPEVPNRDVKPLFDRKTTDRFFGFSDGPLLVTSKEAAAMLSISERKLFDLTKSGTVPHVRLGRRNVRYSRAALEVFVQTQSCGGSK